MFIVEEMSFIYMNVIEIVGNNLYLFGVFWLFVSVLIGLRKLFVFLWMVRVVEWYYFFLYYWLIVFFVVCESSGFVNFEYEYFCVG